MSSPSPVLSKPRLPLVRMLALLLCALCFLSASVISAAPAICNGDSNFIIDSASKIDVVATNCNIFLRGNRNPGIASLTVRLNASSVTVQNSHIGFIKLYGLRGQIDMISIVNNIYVREPTAAGVVPSTTFVHISVDDTGADASIGVINVTQNVVETDSAKVNWPVAAAAAAQRVFFSFVVSDFATPGTTVTISHLAVSYNRFATEDSENAYENYFIRLSSTASAVGVTELPRFSPQRVAINYNQVVTSAASLVAPVRTLSRAFFSFFKLHDLHVGADRLHFAANSYQVHNISGIITSGEAVVVSFVEACDACRLYLGEEGFAVVKNHVECTSLIKNVSGSNDGVFLAAKLSVVSLPNVQHLSKLVPVTFNVSDNGIRFLLPAANYTGSSGATASNLRIVFLNLATDGSTPGAAGAAATKRVLFLSKNRVRAVTSAKTDTSVISLNSLDIAYLVTTIPWTSFSATEEFYRAATHSVDLFSTYREVVYAFQQPPATVLVRSVDVGSSRALRKAESVYFVFFSVDAEGETGAPVQWLVLQSNKVDVSARTTPATNSTTSSSSIIFASLGTDENNQLKVQSVNVSNNVVTFALQHSTQSAELSAFRFRGHFVKYLEDYFVRSVYIFDNVMRFTDICTPTASSNHRFVDFVPSKLTALQCPYFFVVSGNVMESTFKRAPPLSSPVELAGLVTVTFVRLAAASQDLLYPYQILTLLAVSNNSATCQATAAGKVAFFDATEIGKSGLSAGAMVLDHNTVDFGGVSEMVSPAMVIALMYLPIGRWIDSEQRPANSNYHPSISATNNNIIAGSSSSSAQGSRPLRAAFLVTTLIATAEGGWLAVGALPSRGPGAARYDILVANNTVSIDNFAPPGNTTHISCALLWLDANWPAAKIPALALDVQVRGNNVVRFAGGVEAGSPDGATAQSRMMIVVQIDKVKLAPRFLNLLAVTVIDNFVNCSSVVGLHGLLFLGTGQDGTVTSIALNVKSNTFLAELSQPRIVESPVYSVFVALSKIVQEISAVCNIESNLVRTVVRGRNLSVGSLSPVQGVGLLHMFASIDGGDLAANNVTTKLSIVGNTISVTAQQLSFSEAKSISVVVLSWTRYKVGSEAGTPYFPGYDVSDNVVRVDMAGLHRRAAEQITDIISVGVQVVMHAGSTCRAKSMRIDNNSVTVFSSATTIPEPEMPGRCGVVLLVSEAVHDVQMMDGKIVFSRNVVNLTAVHAVGSSAIFTMPHIIDTSSAPASLNFLIQHNSIIGSVFAAPGIFANYSLVAMVREVAASDVVFEGNVIDIEIVRALGAGVGAPVLNSNMAAVVAYIGVDVESRIRFVGNRISLRDPTGAIDPAAAGTTIGNATAPSAAIVYAASATIRDGTVENSSAPWTASWRLSNNTVSIDAAKAMLPSIWIAQFLNAPVLRARSVIFSRNLLFLVARYAGPCSAVVVEWGTGLLGAFDIELRANDVSVAGCSNKRSAPSESRQYFIGIIAVHTGAFALSDSLDVENNTVKFTPLGPRGSATPGTVAQVVALALFYALDNSGVAQQQQQNEAVSSPLAVPRVSSLQLRNNSVLVLGKSSSAESALFSANSELHVTAVALPVSFESDVLRGFEISGNSLSLFSSSSKPAAPPPSTVLFTLSVVHWMFPEVDVRRAVISIGKSRQLIVTDTALAAGFRQSITASVFSFLNTRFTRFETTIASQFHCSDFFAGNRRSRVEISHTRCDDKADLPTTFGDNFNVFWPPPSSSSNSGRLPFLSDSSLSFATQFDFICNEWTKTRKVSTVAVAAALRLGGAVVIERHMCSRTASVSPTKYRHPSKTKSLNGSTDSNSRITATRSCSFNESLTQHSRSQRFTPSDTQPSPSVTRSRPLTGTEQLSSTRTQPRSESTSPSHEHTLTVQPERKADAMTVAIAATGTAVAAIAVIASLSAPVPSILFAQARQQSIDGLIDGVIRGDCSFPVPDGSQPSPIASPTLMEVGDVAAFRYVIGTVVGNLILVPSAAAGMMAFSWFATIAWVEDDETDNDAELHSVPAARAVSSARREGLDQSLLLKRSFDDDDRDDDERNTSGIHERGSNSSKQQKKKPPRESTHWMTLVERSHISILFEFSIALLLTPTAFAATSLALLADVPAPWRWLGPLLVAIVVVLLLLMLKATLMSPVVATAQYFYFEQPQEQQQQQASSQNEMYQRGGAEGEEKNKGLGATLAALCSSYLSSIVAADGEYRPFYSNKSVPGGLFSFLPCDIPNAKTRRDLRNRMRSLDLMRFDQKIFAFSGPFFDSYTPVFQRFFLIELLVQIGLLASWIVAHFLPAQRATNCLFLGASTCLIFFCVLVYMLAKKPICVPAQRWAVVFATSVEFCAALLATLFVTAENREWLKDMQGSLVVVNLALGIVLLLVWLKSSSSQGRRLSAFMHKVITGRWPPQFSDELSDECINQQLVGTQQQEEEDDGSGPDDRHDNEAAASEEATAAAKQHKKAGTMPPQAGASLRRNNSINNSSGGSAEADANGLIPATAAAAGPDGDLELSEIVDDGNERGLRATNNKNSGDSSEQYQKPRTFEELDREMRRAYRDLLEISEQDEVGDAFAGATTDHDADDEELEVAVAAVRAAAQREDEKKKRVDAEEKMRRYQMLRAQLDEFTDL